jgi:hypothetical protein
MIIRCVLLALLLPSSALAAAEPLWHGLVEGPRGLPSVEVNLGYLGRYISTASSPITLRIRTGARGFDGYVGFHIAVDNKRTLDAPVVTRVILGPNSQQTFSTSLRLITRGTQLASLPRRALMIEWRNRSMDVLTARSAGIPPWQLPQPLNVTAEQAAWLSASAQWYAGFSKLIVPIDLWFTLPLPKREAIFRSAIRIVFFGTLPHMPRLADVDRALLPIEFRAEPGILEVPWPYAAGTPKRPVAVSWRPNTGAQFIGSPQLPYLVTNGVSTFVADEEALRTPLPSFTTTLPRPRAVGTRPNRTPRAGEIVSEFRPLIAFLLLTPLSVLAWIVTTRRPRLVAVAAIAATAIALVVVRHSVSAAAGQHQATTLRIQAPGVVSVLMAERDYGPSPIRPADEAATHNSVTWGVVDLGDAEVRTSRTAPGFGEIESEKPWDSNLRVMKKRELGTPATIRVRPSAGDALIVDYETRLPVDYVSADWICGGKRCNGVSAASGSRGSVTVRNSTDSWRCLDCVLTGIPDSQSRPINAGATVALIGTDRSATTSIVQIDPPGSPARGNPYSVEAPLEHTAGVLTATFALAQPPAPGVNASLSVGGLGVSLSAITKVTLTGEAGAVSVDTKRLHFTNFIPFGELRRIAPAGGVVIATIESSAPAPPTESLWFARLFVNEEKP